MKFYLYFPNSILAISSFQSQFLIILSVSFYTFSDFSISFRSLYCSLPHQVILTEQTFTMSLLVTLTEKKSKLPQKTNYSN